MAEGEELPPVVATLEGDDTGFLAMLARDIEAGRAFAADLQAALTEGIGGITVSGAEISGQGIGAAGEAIGEELSAGIAEGAAGLDLATDVQRSLEAVPEVGSAAGEQFAAAFTDAASEAGAAASETSAQVAAAIESEYESAATAVAQIQAQMSDLLRRGLDEEATAIRATHAELINWLSANTPMEFFGAAGVAASGTGLVVGLTASMSDAAAEAGGAAGDALIAALADSAAQGASGVASQVGDAVQAALDDAMAQAGAAGGAILGSAMGAAAQEGIAAVAPDVASGAITEIADGVYASGAGTFVPVGQKLGADVEEGLTQSAAQGGLQFAEEIAEGVYAGIPGLQAAADASMTAYWTEARQVSQLAVSGTDLMSAGLTTFGQPIPGAGGAPAAAPAMNIAVPGLGVTSSGLKSVAADAGDATQALGGMAGMMGGQWLWGILGAVSILPMFSGMLSNSSQQAQAAALAQQQLAQAISQDSDMVGANTVATITNQLSTSGAADTLAGYGISLSEATAAMAGNKGAQDAVTGSLNAQITNLEALIQEQEAHTQNTDDEINKEKQQVEQLEVTRDAMRQLEADVVNAVDKQNQLTQATLYAEQAVDVFNVQVRAGILTLQQQAQQADISAAALAAYMMGLVPGSQAYTRALVDQEVALAHNALTAQINAQALNDSLPAQAQLSNAAVTAATDYQQASTATSAYTNALTALYGQYGNTSQAQAAFTVALDGLKGSITAGSNAVDLNTQAGAKNFQAFEQAAQAAETYSEKLYQQTGDSQTADTALQGMITQLDKAARQAGLTAGQVQTLNTELFGVPNVKDITIHLDPTPAEQAMAALDSFIAGEINSINNTPITPGVRGSSGLKFNASGGPGYAGVPQVVGDGGRTEVFVPGSDGYVYPSIDAGLGALGLGGYGGAGESTTVVNVYLDGRLVTSGVRSNSQQYGRRNSLTGLTLTG